MAVSNREAIYLIAPYTNRLKHRVCSVVGGSRASQTAAVGTMKYLIQFSQQHESFWLPELDTLLELNGVDPGAAYDHDRAWAIVSKGHKVDKPDSPVYNTAAVYTVLRLSNYKAGRSLAAQAAFNVSEAVYWYRFSPLNPE